MSSPELDAGELANQGRAHRLRGEFSEARACFEAALSIDPCLPRAHAGLAVALEHLGLPGDATRHYFEAVRFRPFSPPIWQALGTLLLEQGRVEAAIEAFRTAVAQDPSNTEAHGDLLLALHYDIRATPGDIAAEHLRYGQLHGAAPPFEPHANDPDPERPLRLAYVSSDYYHHPVMRFFAPIAGHHDKAHFHLSLFSSTRREDAVTSAIRDLAGDYHDVRDLSDGALDSLIRSERIDVLIDLTAHTSVARLGALKKKPAPVQFSYIGYPDTTGLAAFDYRLTDWWADPPGSEDFHTEQLVRMPHGFLCYGPPGKLPSAGPPPSIANGFVTFGSFSKPAKWNRQVIETWSRLLHDTPRSRLILHHSNSTLGAAVDFLSAFLANGIAPDRIDIAGRLDDSDHFNLYNRVDVILDTFPYAGTTSTYEALWMGVPVVTLAGAAHAGRTGVSILNQGGKPEWIAEDIERYRQLAALLAADVVGRASWRETAGKAPFIDSAVFTRSLESIYRDAWRRWCVKRSTSSNT